MRVLCDCDGVIFDYASAWIEAYEKCGGYKISLSDLTEWDFETCVPRASGLREYIKGYTHAPGFALGLQPYPGAVKGVRRLMEVADVVFVTAPLNSKTWAHERAESIRHYFGADSTIVSTEHKELIYGNVIVDDKPENVVRWCKHWPEGEGILFDQPWNQQSPLLRVKSWAEILEMVR